MPSCPDGCRLKVLEELRWRASLPYSVRNSKLDPVRAELRQSMTHCLYYGPESYMSGKIVPITVHPRYQRVR